MNTTSPKKVSQLSANTGTSDAHMGLNTSAYFLVLLSYRKGSCGPGVRQVQEGGQELGKKLVPFTFHNVPGASRGRVRFVCLVDV